MLNDSTYFQNNISSNMKNNYYWTDDWSEEFYIELAKAGFISTSYDTVNGLVLLPELQYNYAVLYFENLHVSKKVKKLLKQDDYELCVNTRFDEVIHNFSLQHKDNWLKGEYIEVLKKLHKNTNTKNNFELISVELVDKNTDELIAGEVGYIIGKTYTSLSGFSSKEKKYNNYGTLQLVLLAKYFQEKDFLFWNFGHPHMEYKKRLGCVVYPRNEFLDIFHPVCNKF